MARRRGGSCSIKEITGVKIVSTRGRRNLRGGPRHCVVAKVQPKRGVIKTKGGGKLVDGGKRMFGCFTSASAAKTRANKVGAKKGVC